MTTKNKSFFQTIGSFNKNFWVSSIMELFERWGWYGLFAVFALYLVGSTDTGGLGFNHIQKGIIMTQITGILYFLPLFTGVIADRIGYKLSLIIAYVILISGYYFMGTVTSFWAMYFSFLYVAVGAALFKPVASAIVTRNTDKSNSTLGFGIFYMMVNIGGFVGPAFSSALRNRFGWKIIFVQAAVVITINLLIVLFVYKEKEEKEKSNESFGEAINKAFNNIIEALKDTRLTVLLIIMIGFWTMFNQLFYTLPTFIDDWVDTSRILNFFTNLSPSIGEMIGSDGKVNPEMMINLDAGSIVLFQLVVSYFVLRLRHVSAMIKGFILAIIGIGITFYTANGLYTVLGIMIFAIGEMMTNPTFSSFIALISPKGKEALYMGTYFLPVALGNFSTQIISGNLYQAWSDKLALLKKEMGIRGIQMQEVGSVLSKEQFTEKVRAIEGLDIDKALEFIPSGNVTDWKPVIDSIRKLANASGVKDFSLAGTFSKNDYFAMASEKLNMTQWEMTQMIWNNYHPNKIWYVVVAVGVVTVFALYMYDRMVIKPRENNGDN